MATLQNINAFVPVLALNPPPEGKRAASLTVTIGYAQTTFTQQIQLNAPSGIMLSQVVTLIVDNTANPNPITVTHGALGQTAQVAGGAEFIIPTFSTSGFYSLTIVNAALVVTPVPIVIILLNYERQPNYVGYNQQSSVIINASLNNTLASQFITLSTVGQTQVLLPALPSPQEYGLIELEITIVAVGATAAGQFFAEVYFVDQLGAVVVAVVVALGMATAAGYIGGPWTTRRTFTQPLILAPGLSYEVRLVQLSNVSNVYITASMTGIQIGQ